MTFEARLKQLLRTDVLKATGESGGGCINEGEAYLTDTGKVFVKRNGRPEAKVMFDGEYEGLKAILATNTLATPKPIAVLDHPNEGSALVMEYVKMSPINKHSAKLGEQLARMHLHNQELEQQMTSQSVHKGANELKYVSKFGFSYPTCCGYLPQDNSWSDDWVTFYALQKLQPQIERIQKQGGERELVELWDQLSPKLHLFFKDLVVTSSLLHGDLWGGNVAETEEGPIVFDPASFYGHSEFELSISKMFGGFSNSFYAAYHNIIPKAPGFNERQDLYQLFHYLNHWNHFGSGYKTSTISTLKRLVKMH